LILGYLTKIYQLQRLFTVGRVKDD